MRSRRIGKAAIFALLLAGVIFFAVPFLFMITNSFEQFTYSLPYPPRLFPRQFDLSNYQYIITHAGLLVKLRNSIIVTVSTVILGILISALSAYAFSRIPFKGKEVLFNLYLFTLMIPGVLNIIPQYVILKTVSLTGTLLGLVLLYVSTGVVGNTFFLRGFFSSVPREIDESVVMDGGSHFTIFRAIIVPLSLPSLATLGIFTFQFTWEEFFTAKVILGGNENLLTLPVMVQRLYDTNATKWGWVFAAALMMLIPVVLIYVAFQKRFVIGGLSEGALKG